MNLKPFSSEIAQENSCYCVFRDGSLIRVLEPARRVSLLGEFVHNQFRSLVLDERFTCIGAKSAIKQGSYRFGMYCEMASVEATAGLCRDLANFVCEQPTISGDFTSYIACFSGPNVKDEEHFDNVLWAQVQCLHDQDFQYHGWDPSVSSDPESPYFSFSFAGKAFFLVGLHPASSRWSRRFAWPTLVFNAHYQFEQLRKTGKFERFQQVIRKRDENLQGSINPNLKNFGDASEVSQYSGRPIQQEWRCPLNIHKPATKK